MNGKLTTRREFCRYISVFGLLGGMWQDALADRTQNRPNVILVMTDDQGYGDLSCHGNPILKTPNLDALWARSVRFTDFHVDPFCAPTRAALMTGRYSARTGAYRTSSGRTMMRWSEVTMAKVFADNGYQTGIFGKWHLGDTYPHRPQDRGFAETLWHRCGGVGQLSDYWGNDYFDDIYEHNGRFKRFRGYCTDIWFEGALKFIKRNKHKPFFAYIPTNAPHGPYIVDPSYAAPYRDKVDWMNGANFYGMIANIDKNIGRLTAKLDEWGLADNTILIFMTDNGTSTGVQAESLDAPPTKGYNAGMRGKKSSVYDGGHRVPCFWRWPAGGVRGGRDVGQIAAHIDILPTLIDICGLKTPAGVAFDGTSLSPLLRGKAYAWPDRKLVVQFQGGAYFRYLPQPWRDSVMMTNIWRLMDGERLYNIKADPSQSHDIANEQPEVVAELRKVYEAWWSEVSDGLKDPVRIGIGTDDENPVTLTSQDWYLPVGNPPWSVGQARKLPEVSGPWMLEVLKPGRYEITLRHLPTEANFPLQAVQANVRIGDVEKTAPVKGGDTSVTLMVDLKTGPTQLDTKLIDKDGAVRGAYFAYINYLGNS